MLKKSRDKYIEHRCQEIANYIIDTRCTIREAANISKVSKSTVHRDVTYKLQQVNLSLYAECNKVLQYNKMARCSRGGQARAKLYKH